MRSGGTTRNVATWCALIRGVNGMTLGFPAGFPIVFEPCFETFLLVSFAFQKTKQKLPNTVPSDFLEASFC